VGILSVRHVRSQFDPEEATYLFRCYAAYQATGVEPQVPVRANRPRSLPNLEIVFGHFLTNPVFNVTAKLSPGVPLTWRVLGT